MSPFHPTQDINVLETIALSSPNELKAELPLTAEGSEQIAEYREQLHDILRGEDKRLAITIGPCSIHNKEAGIEYARKLKTLADKVSDQILLVMRVYFEKPRTTVGWKGLINDPHLNDTFDIQTGMRVARTILLEIAEIGLPAATELLEPITPQYIADLLTLTAIGARTTESPTHRQMASGLSMPVGYKNGTDGGLQVAIDAMVAARSQHAFLGIDAEGRTCVVHTKGNEWGHLILRGGRTGSNYDAENLKAATEKLSKAGVSPRFVVDCSHANSNKDFKKQSLVLKDVVDQRIAGNDTIIGLMIESNLHEGNQKLTSDLSLLKHGISITDGCIGWEETEELILNTHAKLKAAQVVTQS
ncbi:Phospho-2-dehydro-3-deoxyheptonate aldolase, Tyr-sensitive [Polystyrenella longa]|uniref:Phospho-2-dehydro-3-deoxyheptonate aldolase n=1 Tax=Polystyrenella longa TaxID=2528007 RepID=A0A518CKJ9_9PLAN|nr:3-deoxy-7-phosphoheptulonate synthase [Polystyrenella longa]QDU79753.1 Phospho-2-dehydro-3-deoxyheptonate aldolase, Tyr-sensitive [Polystyrenella longa]